MNLKLEKFKLEVKPTAQSSFLTKGISKRRSNFRNPSPHFHNFTLALWEPAKSRTYVFKMSMFSLKALKTLVQ